MKQEIEKLFEGVSSELLTEEVKAKIGTLVETKVNEKVNTKVNELEEQFENFKSQEVDKLEEATVEYVDAYLIDKIDSFLDKVSDKWLEEHTVEVEDGIKAEMFDKVITGIKSTLAEAQIKEDEIVEQTSLKEERDKIKSDYNEIFEEKQKLENTIKGMEAEKVFKAVTADLSETEKAKALELTEDYDIDNIEEFKSKVETIVESIGSFVDDGEITENDDDLEEDTESETDNDAIKEDTETEDVFGLKYL